MDTLHFPTSDLIALGQVLFIDVVLAGDNAVIVGLSVAGLPPKQRRRAILFGIGAATLLRILLATVTLQLLAVVGVTLAGGLLLLWVCWRTWREVRGVSGAAPAASARRGLRGAVVRIVLADLSMSLDNVLAVAGAAEGRLWVLIVGLAISVVLMGVAASLIAKLLERQRWIAWIGLAIVLFVALRLIWEGSLQVRARLGRA